MLEKKEILWIIIISLIMGFIISWSKIGTLYPIDFLFAFIILLTSVLAKKIASPHYNIKITHKPWSLKYWGLYKTSKFKKPIPLGLFIPFVISFMSLGTIKMFTLLQFDAENLRKKRALRKRGKYRYSEINDSDIAFTAAWGFWALILLSIIAIFLKQPDLAKYSIYYGIWNLIPFGNLDGSKLFFGSVINWIILIIIYILSLITILII